MQRSLNAQLFRGIGKAGMQDCACALGFWSDGVVVFDEEDDVGLLADFAIYEHKAGRAAIERRVTSADAPMTSVSYSPRCSAADSPSLA